jgi:DNA-binding CsgD family transcriptional regulator
MSSDTVTPIWIRGGLPMIDDRRLLQFYVSLTPRQREVLQLVSMGLSNYEVADRLFIAASVVAGHLTNIYEEMTALNQAADTRPNRYTVICLFNGFFDRYPELDNFQSPHRPHGAAHSLPRVSNGHCRTFSG